MTGTPSNRSPNRPRTPEQAPEVPVGTPDAPEPSTAPPRVLADWHAHEAHRLAHTTAGHTHALLAIAHALLAQEQPR